MKAKSETGKSSLSRFLSRFCQTPDDKENYTDMIRKGKTSCSVSFVYDNGYKVILGLSTSERLLGYLNPDGECEEVYDHHSITEEVLQRFGFIYDSANGFLANVFSRDIPMLLVQTNEVLNGSMMVRILTDRNAERALEYLKDREDKISFKIKEYRRVKSDSITATAMIKDVDVDYLKCLQREIDNFSSVVTRYTTIAEALKGFIATRSTQVFIPENSPTAKELEHIIVCKELLDKITKTFTNKPSSPILDSKSVESLYLCADIFSRVGKVFKSVPKPVSLNPSCIESISKCSGILIKIISCITCHNTTKVEKGMFDECIREQVQLNDELGVCPLCGGELK